MTNRAAPTLVMPTVHETVVDGIQTFWVDAGAPFTAALMFAVGIADETLHTRGITHLVEHVVLAPQRDVVHQFNGSVGMAETSFWASGAVDDVVAFAQRVAAELADPALDRLETEAGVLIAESIGFQSTSHARLLAARFGPWGPGLIAYPEFGLRRITPDEVRTWAATHFTAENAVLALTGPPPDGMRIPLPRGRRRQVTLPPDAAGFGDSPTRVTSQNVGVAVGAFGERSVPLVMAARAVTMRGQERMRHELGRVYAVADDYVRLTPEEAYLYWGADCASDHVVEVTAAFGEVIDDIAAAGPSRVELDRLVGMFAQIDVMNPDEVARGELYRYATDALRGDSPYDMAMLLEEMRSTTRRDAAAALSSALTRAVAIAVDGVDFGFTDAPSDNDHPIRGKAYRFRDDGIGMRFVIGEAALSALSDHSVTTLRFDELLVAEHPADGGRVLIDARGSWIGVPPHRRLRKLIAALDERVPRHVVVPPVRAAR